MSGLIPRRARGAVAALALSGLGGAAAAVLLQPARGWPALLVAGFLFTAIALGAVVFLALAYVTRAGWTVVVKRVAEGVGATLPVGAAALLALLAGLRWIYPWADPGADDEILRGRHGFENPTAFGARLVAVLAIWLLFAWLLRRSSLAQDARGGLSATRLNEKLSAALLVVVGLSFSLASFDWLMSVEVHWASTIYGLYHLGGLLIGGVAAITVVAIVLRRRGLLPQLRDDHLHDLGKLVFGFSTFWAYLWFSQFLLVWYANLDEEIPMYLTRWQGGWSFLFWLNPILGWVLPFFTLLPRPAKRSESNLFRVCLLLLAARWLDVYLAVVPARFAEAPGIGAPELAATVGVGAACLWLLDRVLLRAPLIARNDPYLVESLHHHA